MEKARRGAAGMPRVFSGPGMARRKTPAKDEERKASRRDETQGGLSFGDFSLATQRKVTRSLQNKIEKCFALDRL